MKTALAAIALATLLATSQASAVEGAPDWAYAMAHDLMSPFCPGRTLAECPSPQAANLRFWILTQAAAGTSEDELRDMLYQRFGDVLLAAPRAEGWGLAAYAIPIAFFVVGGPVVVWIIRRLTDRAGRAGPPSPGGSGPPGGPPTSIDPDLERELEKELAEF